mmetsp:Transcript_130091/g.224881  ORF Transcript_130091/g.224881 Transcript_130091/m.224881 type:complete len:126 (-) Transcript_130091:383-760(-)
MGLLHTSTFPLATLGGWYPCCIHNPTGQTGMGMQGMWEGLTEGGTFSRLMVIPSSLDQCVSCREPFSSAPHTVFICGATVLSEGVDERWPGRTAAKLDNHSGFLAFHLTQDASFLTNVFPVRGSP